MFQFSLYYGYAIMDVSVLLFEITYKLYGRFLDSVQSSLGLY